MWKSIEFCRTRLLLRATFNCSSSSDGSTESEAVAELHVRFSQARAGVLQSVLQNNRRSDLYQYQIFVGADGAIIIANGTILCTVVHEEFRSRWPYQLAHLAWERLGPTGETTPGEFLSGFGTLFELYDKLISETDSETTAGDAAEDLPTLHWRLDGREQWEKVVRSSRTSRFPHTTNAPGPLYSSSAPQLTLQC